VVLGVRSPGTYGTGNVAGLLGIVVAITAVTVIGVSIGLMTRSPSASIVIVVVVLLLPKAASGLLGGLQPWIVGASPGTVVTEIVGGSHVPTAQTFPAGTWAAAFTMVGVALVVAMAGAATFSRRDG
jgi:hypothetical protein